MPLRAPPPALGRPLVLAAALCVAVYVGSSYRPQGWGAGPEATSPAGEPPLLLGRRAVPAAAPRTATPCTTDTSRRSDADGVSVGLVSPHLGTTNDFQFVAERLGLDVTVSTRKPASWSSRTEALQVCVCVGAGESAVCHLCVILNPLTGAAAAAAGVGSVGRNVLQAL